MKWSIKLKDEIKDLAFSTYVSIFYNLNDLADKAQAIKNLGLFDKLASIEEIKKIKILATAIKTNNLHRFVSKTSKDKYNNKISKFVTTDNHFDIDNNNDAYFHNGEKRFYLKYKNKYRLFGGNTVLYKVGQATFLGKSNEVRIPHNLHDDRNVGITPDFVSIKPLHSAAKAGDIWVKKDSNFIYVGNTGAANIEFQYMIYAPKNMG